jgi:sugar lactone lactonase YvrE
LEPPRERSPPPLVPYRSFLLALLLVAQFLGFTGRASGQDEGWGLVVDRQGDVFFTDVPSGTVWKITPRGDREKVAIDKHSRALVLGEDGRLYGTEPAPLAALWTVDREGGLSYVLSPNTNLPLDLQSFTLDRQGALYSASQGSGTVLLQRRTPAGKIETVAGGGRGHADGRGAAARFSEIDGMVWGPGGQLYVADGPYVRTVDGDGAVKTLGGGPVTEEKWEEDLLGLAVAPDGTVYAADFGRRRVLQIPPGGKARTLLKAGRYWSPAGVALAGNELYLLEHPGGLWSMVGDLGVGPYARVRRLPLNAPRGQADVLATLWGRNTIAGLGGLAAVLLLLTLLWRRRRRSRFGSGRRLRL